MQLSSNPSCLFEFAILTQPSLCTCAAMQTSDPLTQFAVVFSAVIHDADHPGVPNAQLVKEKTRNAQFYKKSIAEQNSVDLVWALLMSPEYNDLRSCIYSNEEELQRFRQLVVNTVLATDIVDKELQALRKARWENAFSNICEGHSNKQLDTNKKATIVIEHLIQVCKGRLLSNASICLYPILISNRLRSSS